MEELTPIERAWMEKLPGCSAEGCLEADEILEVAQRGRRAHDYTSRMAHIAACPGCRSTLKLLREVEVARPAVRVFAPVWPSLRYLVVAGAAVAVLALWFGFRGSAGSGTGTVPVAVHQTPPVKSPRIVAPEPERTPSVVAEKHVPAAKVATPRRRRLATRRARHVAPKLGGAATIDRYADASGTLEGSVGSGEVIEGEVGMSGGVVEGEVHRKIPPPPEG